MVSFKIAMQELSFNLYFLCLFYMISFNFKILSQYMYQVIILTVGQLMTDHVS